MTVMHGAIYYPPFGAMATLLAGSPRRPPLPRCCDAWIGKRTTAGSGFFVVEGRKPP
jgi:hypothetical protein